MLGFLMLGAIALIAEDFTLRYFGIGPINVHTTLAISKDGSQLNASAVNNTDEPIKSIRLCLHSDGAKDCLFEMWNTEPFKPGDRLEWTVTSKRKPRNAVHEVEIESLSKFSGPELSQFTVSEALALVDSDPLRAESLVGQSLKLDPTNEEAGSLARALLEKIASAEEALRNVEHSIWSGDLVSAEAGLAKLNIYNRARLRPRFDDAARELKSATAASSARRFWSEGRVAEAIHALGDIGKPSPEEAFAVGTALQLRKEIVDSETVREQQISPTTNDNFVARASLLHFARDADPGSPEVEKLISANVEAFVDRVSAALPALKLTGPSEARLRLALRSSAADRLGEKFQEPSPLLRAAFPFLRVRIFINDPQGCLPKDAMTVLESSLRRGLAPVADLSTGSDGDIQFSLVDVSCPHADVPRQSIQSVNSTYVAGHNQLANPVYTQLQTDLASAQAVVSQINASAIANPFG